MADVNATSASVPAGPDDDLHRYDVEHENKKETAGMHQFPSVLEDVWMGKRKAKTEMFQCLWHNLERLTHLSIYGQP